MIGAFALFMQDKLQLTPRMHHRRVQRTASLTHAMPTFEQVASPAGGFWQVRQPSVHSMQVASGGTKTFTRSGTGLRRSGRSAASAGVSHSKATAAKSQNDGRSIMAVSLPILGGSVECA